jgi:exosortase K
MNNKLRWSAQLLVIGVCALALKAFYSNASPDDLRWILGPTTFLVELASGRSFSFEAHSGYMSSDHTFLIAASCAGVNFLLTSFLMLALRKLWNERFNRIGWHFIPLAAAGAYVGTLIANTARICIALYLQRHPVELDGLDAAQIHRLEGIVVYFAFLVLMFMLTESFTTKSRSSLVRLFLFPLLVYYSVAIGIPLANGSFHQGQLFWEHAAFVFTVPLMLIIPTIGVHWVCRGRQLQMEARVQNSAVRKGGKAGNCNTSPNTNLASAPLLGIHIYSDQLDDEFSPQPSETPSKRGRRSVSC